MLCRTPQHLLVWYLIRYGRFKLYGLLQKPLHGRFVHLQAVGCRQMDLLLRHEKSQRRGTTNKAEVTVYSSIFCLVALTSTFLLTCPRISLSMSGLFHLTWCSAPHLCCKWWDSFFLLTALCMNTEASLLTSALVLFYMYLILCIYTKPRNHMRECTWSLSSWVRLALFNAIVSSCIHSQMTWFHSSH